VNAKTYAARHAQTLVGSLGRIAQQPVAAFMTMAVIGIALALPLCLHMLLQNAAEASGGWNSALDISVYLTKNATLARAEAIAAELRARDDIAKVRVISAAEALRQFRDASGFGSALDALNENPLPNTLIVTPALAASTPAGSDALQGAIAALPDIETVQLDTDWVKRLNAMLDILRRVVVLAGALLGAGVALVVGNTIRLDVLNRRAEIEVMKLVGGSDGFARRPFLYSGIWYGLGGGILALILVAIAAALLAAPAERLALLYGSAYRLTGLDWGTGGIVLMASVALSWLGSWLAATRHIRAIEPS
jgi:cell division transport system permease protein